MGRTVATVAVGLVLLAGCAGFAPGGESTPTDPVDPTATPTPQPARTTDTPAAGVVTYPEGWSETGVRNATTALASHYRAVLTGPSTTVFYRSGVINATSDRAANTTLDMEIDPGKRRLHASINGTEGRSEGFFADGTFTEWDVRNETVTSRSDASFVGVAQSIDAEILKSQLLLYRLELNDTVASGPTTVMVYDVVGVPDNAVSRTYGSATSASGRILVSERGRVLEVETTVEYTSGRVTYRYTQTDIGRTDVETPDWYP